MRYFQLSEHHVSCHLCERQISFPACYHIHASLLLRTLHGVDVIIAWSKLRSSFLQQAEYLRAWKALYGVQFQQIGTDVLFKTCASFSFLSFIFSAAQILVYVFAI
jgi:hypothetical protein